MQPPTLQSTQDGAMGWIPLVTGPSITTLSNSSDLLQQCGTTATSLMIPESFSEDQCLEVVRQLQGMDKCIRWWLGDAIAAAEKRYGAAKRIAQVAGVSQQSLHHCSRLSEKFEDCRRRQNLSWSHHAEVVSLPEEEQEKWLDYAEEQGLSRQALRTEIKAAAAAVEVEAEDVGDDQEEERIPPYSPIIKPSDNWNFATVAYERVPVEEDLKSHGYIPGDIYANCFWYYAPDGGQICDLMAGSGQALRVYEDRERWGRGRDLSFTLRLFDRFPRGPYRDHIEKLDATGGLPAGYHPDYIFMDVPYFQMVAGAYSADPDDIANMDLPAWGEAMQQVAAACATAQHPGSLCTVMAPNTADWDAGRIMVCDLIRQWWTAAGYALHDIAYSTRRIQQAQNPTMASTNNKAKRTRVMLSDIAELQTFKKIP